MALLSWLRKKPVDEDYEQVLASLALSIQKRQTMLSEIRLRERRATLLVTVWAFAGWAAYAGLWWTGVVGRGRGLVNELWGVPVIVGPLAILFARRIIQQWYTQKRNAEEKTLKSLLVQQRNKIEDIKKKTNYYTTKNLLERYDDGPVQRKRAPPPIQSEGLTPVQGQAQIPQTPARQGQPGSPALPPLPTPRRQWYDKLADALLGDDTASTGPSPMSRYALICERCFAHNGLVKEEQWADAQYVCPKCGHFNASSRSRNMGGNTMISPTTPRIPSGVQSSSPSSDHDRPLSPSKHNSQSAPAPLEASQKPLLSESTVLVEKVDAEPEEHQSTSESDRDGEERANTNTRMEVDM